MASTEAAINFVVHKQRDSIEVTTPAELSLSLQDIHFDLPPICEQYLPTVKTIIVNAGNFEGKAARFVLRKSLDTVVAGKVTLMPDDDWPWALIIESL